MKDIAPRRMRRRGCPDRKDPAVPTSPAACRMPTVIYEELRAEAASRQVSVSVVIEERVRAGCPELDWPD